MEFTWSHCVSVYVGGWGGDEWGSRGMLYRNVCLSLYMAVRWRANCSRFTPTPLSSGCCDLPPLPPRPFKGLGQPKMSQWSLNKQNVVFFIWRIYMERQVTENVFQLHFFWHNNLQPSAGTHARKFSKSAFLVVFLKFFVIYVPKNRSQITLHTMIVDVCSRKTATTT